MKKSLVVLFVFALSICFLSGSRNASATPDLKKRFDEKYKDNAELKKVVDEAKCNLCHIDKMPKTARNEYGKALSEAVKPGFKQRLKDDKAAALKEFDEALTAVESKKSSGGMTFGELLKAGKAPATK